MQLKKSIFEETINGFGDRSIDEVMSQARRELRADPNKIMNSDLFVQWTEKYKTEIIEWACRESKESNL